MKLSKLLENLKPVNIINYKNVNISNLSLKSSEIEKNGLFFAISGNNHNGENYVEESVKNGAVAVVSVHKLDINAVQIIVEDVRFSMAIIAKNFFHKADEKLKIIQIN